jgi:hypothetical protein
MLLSAKIVASNHNFCDVDGREYTSNYPFYAALSLTAKKYLLNI